MDVESMFFPLTTYSLRTIKTVRDLNYIGGP